MVWILKLAANVAKFHASYSGYCAFLAPKSQKFYSAFQSCRWFNFVTVNLNSHVTLPNISLKTAKHHLFQNIIVTILFLHTMVLQIRFKIVGQIKCSASAHSTLPYNIYTITFATEDALLVTNRVKLGNRGQLHGLSVCLGLMTTPAMYQCS